MLKRDVVTAAAFLALGAAAAALTAALPERSLPNTPGPAFFPWVATVAMLVLACALLARGLTAPPRAGDMEEPGPAGLAPMLALLGAFIAYIALLPRLGFLIATAPFIAGLTVLYGERRPALVALTAVVATAGLYIAFRHVFQIILPQGVLTGVVP
jgi:hypothetical protein